MKRALPKGTERSSPPQLRVQIVRVHPQPAACELLMPSCLSPPLPHEGPSRRPDPGGPSKRASPPHQPPSFRPCFRAYTPCTPLTTPQEDAAKQIEPGNPTAGIALSETSKQTPVCLPGTRPGAGSVIGADATSLVRLRTHSVGAELGRTNMHMSQLFLASPAELPTTTGLPEVRGTTSAQLVMRQPDGVTLA